MALHSSRTMALMLAAILGMLILQSAASILPSPVPFQWTPVQKHRILTPEYVVAGQDTQVLKSNSASVDGGYQVVGRTGPGQDWGAAVDIEGKPIYRLDGSFKKTGELDASVAPDFTSLLPGTGSTLNLLIHFESPSPSSIAFARLQQDSATGQLSLLSKTVVDFSKYGGLTAPCAGSVTPWNTHLGSEEADPDARVWFAATSWETLASSFKSRVASFARYWGLYLQDFPTTQAYWEAVKAKYNPYRYGHITEVSVDAQGAAHATKWYTMGRAGWELGLIMPDRKTVYLSDDAGRNVGFFKFVADVAGQLGKGSLYAAKASQQGNVNGGTFKISWIKLGSSSQEALRQLGDTTTFADIFDRVEPSNGQCPAGYTGIFAAVAGSECLKLKPGMETAAAFLETRRYAAYLGATTEFSKWEGMSYDTKRNVVYAALTAVDQGMLEENGTQARLSGADDVRLPANRCGCIYKLELDSSYDVKAMSGALCGDPVYGLIPRLDSAGTGQCNVDGIAGPDNVWYVPDQDALLISEDTGTHENNFLWWWDISSGVLTRILSAPYGAETTGTAVYDRNGWRYIWVNMQHPYSGSSAKLAEPGNTGIGGWVGFFGPFKVPTASAPAMALSHIPYPRTNLDRHRVQSSSRVVRGQRSDTEYMVVSRSNRLIGGRGPAVTGEMLDINGNPIYEYAQRRNYTVSPNKGTKAEVSDNADFFSMHAVCDKRFGLLQHEAPSPAAAEVYDLSQTKEGFIAAKGGRELGSSGFAAWGGLWTPCAGSTTPYDTRLGGEEYEPNARATEAATTVAQFASASSTLLDMTRYFGAYYPPIDQVKQLAKPYRYGFAYEAKVQYDGSVNIVKHYTLGRVAFELAYMMPDSRTVYNTDDGTNVGFFKFVADDKYDLSSGTLYAAKMTQLSAENGGTFNIEWIRLGHATQEELLAMPDYLQFSDIFDAALPNNLTCPSAFTSIHTGWGCECVKLRPGMEKAAAFFETRRYAAYLGATVEFSKWEGITFDPKRGRIYTAMSVVRQGMEDFGSSGRPSTSYDACGPNHVRVQYNRCGCVYALDVDGDYSANKMYPLICGIPDSSIAENDCHINGISEPDNVAYLSGHDQLLIGEDTGEHQNDVVWVYDLETKSLTRVFTTPYGAETTSPYWYPNLGGHAYMTAVVQHPYGESDQEKADDPESTGTDSTIGVIGPIPVVPGTSNSVSDCRDTVYAVTVWIKASNNRRRGRDDDDGDDDDDDNHGRGRGKGRRLLHDDDEHDDDKMYAPCARVAAYLQYKAERVLGTAANVSPEAVASKVHHTECDEDDHDRRGCDIDVKVTVAVGNFRDAIALETKLNSNRGVRQTLQQSVRTMLGGRAKLQIKNVARKPTTRLNALKP